MPPTLIVAGGLINAPPLPHPDSWDSSRDSRRPHRAIAAAASFRMAKEPLTVKQVLLFSLFCLMALLGAAFQIPLLSSWFPVFSLPLSFGAANLAEEIGMDDGTY